MNLGSWDIDDVLPFTANTHTTAGEASDADGAPTYRVYENETATPILTGTMSLLDSTNTDGFYSELITLSAANGFELGKGYTIRISATVGGTTGVTLRYFQVGAKVDVHYVGGEPATPDTEPLIPLHTANVKRLSSDGTVTDYTPASDTDAARGTALLAAVAAFVSGDEIVVPAGSFDLGTTAVSAIHGFKMRGAGVNKTIVYGDVGNGTSGQAGGSPIGIGVVQCVGSVDLRDMTLTNTTAAKYGAAVAFNQTSDGTQFLSNLRLTGRGDIVHIVSSAKTMDFTGSNLVGFGPWDGYVINTSFGASTFRWTNCEAYLTATSIDATTISGFSGPSAGGTMIIDGGLVLITNGGGGATGFRGVSNQKSSTSTAIVTGALRIVTPATGGVDFITANSAPTYVGPNVVYDYSKLSGTITALKSNVLQPTTPQRTLDVSATGEGGLDFDNVKQATGATTLNNITVPTVTTVSALGAQAKLDVNAEADTALADAGVNTTAMGRLDVAVSTRNATAPDNSGIAAIKAKTDNLPAAPAATGDIPSAATVATQVNTTLTAAHGTGSWQEGTGGGGGGSGTGDTPVTAATLDDDGDDMLVKTAGGTGIDDVDIRAYVAAEWLSDPSAATIRAETRSLSDGTWEDVLMLDSGITYKVVMSKSGYTFETTEVTP